MVSWQGRWIHKWRAPRATNLPSTRDPRPSILGASSFAFLVDHLHCDGNEAIELFVRRFRQQRLGPDVIVRFRVALQQASQEADERNPLQLGAPLPLGRLLLAAQQRLETMSV